MADNLCHEVTTVDEDTGYGGILACWLLDGHEGAHWDMADKISWQITLDRPLTPSADLPACRDEDPAHHAALAACYPDPPDYQHPEDDDE